MRRDLSSGRLEPLTIGILGKQCSTTLAEAIGKAKADWRRIAGRLSPLAAETPLSVVDSMPRVPPS